MFGLAVLSGAVGILASIPSQQASTAVDPTTWLSQPIGIGTIVLVVVGFLTKQLVPGWVHQEMREDRDRWRHNYELEREARMLEQGSTHKALGGASVVEDLVAAFRQAAGEEAT